VVSPRDSADLLLAGAVRLLPAGRRDWGTAMRAELAGISSRRARWEFTAGCVRVVATRPAVWRRLGYPLLPAGVLTAVLWWTSRIGYAPLHWGVVGLVGLLVTVAWLGHHRAPLGPVRPEAAARGVRAVGHLLVGTLAFGVVASFLDGRGHDPHEQAHVGVPIFAVVLTGYLLGFLAATARRSPATPHALTAGIVTGTAGAALWTGTTLALPPVPANVGFALVAIVAAMAAASLAARRGNGELGGQAALAALCAGATTALLIVLAVGLISTFGPSWLIPDLAPAALTKADDLAQSRVEIEDPYVAILFLGWLIAVVQAMASVTLQPTASRTRDIAPG
jgi:hypothetical protein